MPLGNKNRVTAESFRAIHDNVFVTQLDSGPHITAGGIIRPDDNMSATGIHPRWGQVWTMGPDVEGISIGDWVLIEHGRWTNAIDMALPEGLVRVWRIDWPDAVMLATSNDPRETHLAQLPAVQHPASSEDLVRSVAPSIIRKREF